MKPLFLFVGISGSGKTTIANLMASSYNLKVVNSYTTRPPRTENEQGHIFVSKAEFNKLKDIVAYTKYNNYEYCATKEQVDNSDIYVIDTKGVEFFIDNYLNDNDRKKRPIYIFYLDVEIPIAIIRMQKRNDTSDKILERLINDTRKSWFDELNKILQKKELKEFNITLKKINANHDPSLILCEIDGIISNDSSCPKHIIFCDVDNVVNNLMQITLNEFNRKSHSHYDFNLNYINQYDLHKVFSPFQADEIIALFTSEKVLSNLTVQKNAQYYMETLIKYYNCNFYFATATNPEAFYLKYQWLMDKFPLASGIINIQDKTLLTGDILIEDCVETLKYSNMHRICLDYPWNRDINDAEFQINRTYNWEDIFKTIIDILYFKEDFI